MESIKLNEASDCAVVRDIFETFQEEIETKKKLDIKQPINLCLEGGGIKGVSYVGVASYLQQKNIISKRFVSSSAGSIFGGMLACNASSEFMEDVVKSTDFVKFMDGWGWTIGLSYRLYWKMGMYNGDYFKSWYGDLLKKLTGDSDITLKEIFDRYGNEIIVTTTDLNNRKTCFLNYRTHPDLCLKDAVRMSMSLPVFYVPVLYNGIYYIDGGYLDNFPIDYLDMYHPDEQVLGFKMTGGVSNKITGWDTLMMNLLESAVEKIENLEIRDDDICRTVNIDTFGIVCTDFDISAETINKLIESGYNATEKFFESLVY